MKDEGGRDEMMMTEEKIGEWGRDEEMIQSQIIRFQFAGLGCQ